MTKQYKFIKSEGRKRQRLDAQPTHSSEGTTEEILALEVADLLQRPKLETESLVCSEKPDESIYANDNTNEPFYPTELEVEYLSSTGDGLARGPSNNHVYVVPFSVPGDKVLAKVRKDTGNHSWSNADFLDLLRPSPQREGVIPKCKYFSKCSGCQLQMLPYDDQLDHKKNIVEKAFQSFSGLQPDQIPVVGSTIGSPLQYGYRTKLTPHFDGPPRKRGKESHFTEVPPIGFIRKNFRRVLDIESCPIATDIVQEGLKVERQKVATNLAKYRRGATILVRETTQRIPTVHDDSDQKPLSNQKPMDLETFTPPTSTAIQRSDPNNPQLNLHYPTHKDIKTYTSDNAAFSTEYIASYKLTSRAGSFFQNNNSILPTFVNHVRRACLSSPTELKIKYLLDAYCGSGLFTVTLSPIFTSALGIDIDGRAIEAARLNAETNDIPNAGFIEADAGDLFADVPFPRDETLVVLDPPRKGASVDFLRQLCTFGAVRVVYVSCNVHTQARDVGMLVSGFKEQGVKWKYEVESLRGFDFFPQTGHVEGLCVLNRVAVATE